MKCFPGAGISGCRVWVCGIYVTLTALFPWSFYLRRKKNIKTQAHKNDE